MRVNVQWYDGDGAHRGNESTTLAEIDQRCHDAHCTFHVGAHGTQAGNPRLVRVLRLASGEVARVFKSGGGQ